MLSMPDVKYIYHWPPHMAVHKNPYVRPTLICEMQYFSLFYYSGKSHLNQSLTASYLEHVIEMREREKKKIKIQVKEWNKLIEVKVYLMIEQGVQ